MNQDHRADIVFLMDCTVSMKPYFEASKRMVKDIVVHSVLKFNNQVST
jgi:O-acetylhomoserine/O-acetylserine sulfhydrylase-like pyridoxal-dependent enzyme